jgi:hypothetical protein
MIIAFLLPFFAAVAAFLRLPPRFRRRRRRFFASYFHVHISSLVFAACCQRRYFRYFFAATLMPPCHFAITATPPAPPLIFSLSPPAAEADAFAAIDAATLPIRRDFRHFRTGYASFRHADYQASHAFPAAAASAITS